MTQSSLPAFPFAAALTVSLATSPTLEAENVGSAVPEHIVVTATRVPVDVANIGESITLIDAEQARNGQKMVVSDLLTTTPGVTVSRNGGFGGTTSVRIRGAESEHTVVLIDGVKLNDPSSPGGGFNFAHLLVNDTARIEVLRGAQSVLWGSQAIGGVVNIVTPAPEGPLSTVVSGQIGSYETAAIAGRLEAGTDRFAWRAGANYLSTDGVSAFDENLGGREKDGYRNVGAHARALWYVSPSITAELRSYGWRGRSEIDGFPPPTFAFADTREYTISKESVSYGGINIDTLGGKLAHRFGIAYTDTDRENRDPDLSVVSAFDAFGRNLRWEYQGTLELSDALVAMLGAEREKSRLSTVSPSEFDPTSTPLRRDITLDSLYGLVQFSPVQALTLTAGLRHDDHEAFGGHTTTQAAVAWSVNAATLLRASYGEGFKAPTLYQLYSQYGAPTLNPEESEDWDVGVEQRLGESVVLSATYFDRDTSNLVDFVSCFGSSAGQCTLQPFGYYENVQQTTADGVELGLAAQLGSQLHFSANYTHVNAKNAAPGRDFGKELRRRPRESAYAELTFSWPFPLTTTIAGLYVGRSFDDVANRFELEEYLLVDLRASYQLYERITLYARVENLFDERYQTTRRYGTLGRGVHAGFRLGF